MIPEIFLEELLQKTDIVELIDSYVPLKKQGTSYVSCCPFHNESTPSFNVIAKKQFFHCFGCSTSGNAISFVMKYLNQDFILAVENLANRLGLQIPNDNKSLDSNKKTQTLELYEILNEVCDLYQKNLKASQEAISYLKNRGISGEIAKKYQLGYAPNEWHYLISQKPLKKMALVNTGMVVQKEDSNVYDRYRQRIMFPIYDKHGNIIGFGGRAINAQQKPKYLNSPLTPIFEKSRELYGLHNILQASKDIDYIIVVEGYIDVISLAQHGISSAVATLGTAISSYQIQLLSKYTKKIIFCFDGDEAGRQAGWKALENCLPHVNSGIDARFIFLPDNHDPDSLIRQEGSTQFSKRLQESQPLHQFFLKTLTNDINTANFANISQLINNVKPYILKIQDGAYRQLLFNELARLTKIDNNRIENLILKKQNLNKFSNAKTANNTELTTNIHAKNQINIIKRTPINLATALLLQNPEIFIKCKPYIFKHVLEDETLFILQKILQQIANSPQITTAMLIELWRNTPMFEEINNLATWETKVPTAALINEFIEIILFLQKQNLENKINKYLTKSKQEGLTNQEMLKLSELLKLKSTSAIQI